jgi:hypothetical protein
MPNSIIELSRNEVKLISGGDATTPEGNTTNTTDYKKPYNFTISPDNTDITSNVQPPAPPKKSWATWTFDALVVMGSISLMGIGVNEIRKCVLRGKEHIKTS